MQEFSPSSDQDQQLTNIGMCWPADDKHLGTLPMQFNKDQFGASIIWRFLWVVWACHKRKRDVYWRKENEERVDAKS